MPTSQSSSQFQTRLVEALEACGDGDSVATAWNPDAMIAVVKMLRAEGACNDAA